MKILERFNIKPKDRQLYYIAFSHSSFANETGFLFTYERLEFLGDAVLDLVISDYFYNNTDFEEGQMTKLRASYVCENALAEYALKLGLNEYIKLGHGEEMSGGNLRKPILADVFEAFIGAIYIDQGYEIAKQVIEKTVIPYIKDKDHQFLNDYKSILQELVQTMQKTIHYVVLAEKGPSHHKEFTVVAKIDNIIYGQGIASSKKEAEQKAAQEAMEKLAL